MALPDPVPGLLIRYSYLWHDEAVRKQEEGAKDRPCMIVVAVQREGAATMVTVAPITHSPPRADAPAIEVPSGVKRRLRLDDNERSWIITNDLNRFAWPGPDIRPIGTEPDAPVAYGLVPRGLFYAVRDAIVAHHDAGSLHLTRRK